MTEGTAQANTGAGASSPPSSAAVAVPAATTTALGALPTDVLKSVVNHQTLLAVITATTKEVACAMQASVGETVSTALQVQNPSSSSSMHKLSTRDVKLLEFSSSKKDALHIEPEFYVRLIEWMKEARTLLGASSLPNTAQVYAIVNALQNLARRVLMMHYNTYDLSTVQATDLHDRLVQCILDYGTVFVTQALNMKFHDDSLLQDVERFCLLLAYGTLPVGSISFGHQLLCTKLRNARSSLLIDAASTINKPLDYRPNETLPQLITRTIDIVTRLNQIKHMQNASQHAV